MTVAVALVIALAAPAALLPSAAVAAQTSTPTSEEPAAQTPESEIIPDRYIVTIEADATNADVREVRNDATADGAQVHHTYNDSVNGFAATMTPEELAAFRAEHPRARITPDQTVQVSETPYGLDRIDQRAVPLDGAFSLPATGAGVTAFVIDTGIRATHREFGGRVAPGFTAIDDGNGTTDPVFCRGTGDGRGVGHGTHVAGTLGGASLGVAPGVTLVPVRVLGCNGSGAFSAVIAGVEYVSDWKRKNSGSPAVANMSLGAGDYQPLDAAIRASVALGVTYVVAAGNEGGADACKYTPGRVTEAITVAATDSSDRRASYSNVGRCVDIFAPGTSILSASQASDTGERYQDGTSMATPHVAGAVATYLQLNPAAIPAQVQQTLIDTSTQDAICGLDPSSPNRLLFGRFSLPGPNRPPAVPVPSARLMEGRSARSGAPVTVVIGAPRDPDGQCTARVELDASTDGGATWGRVAVTTSAPTSIALVLQSRTTLFRTRAADARGLLGVSATSAPVVLRTIDQARGTTFAPGSAWTRKASASSLGGSSARSAKKNATARFTFTGRQISWIARRNDASGKAAVFIDGVRVEDVNLYSDDNSYRRVVFASGVLAAGRHTITVKVLGKKSGDSYGKAVDIDGWIVRS
ncbi:MAG: S8 family peptidase [Sporichthyaceae bacterium]